MTISKRVQHELLQAAPTVRVNSRKRSNCIKDSTREAKAEREAIAAQTKGQAWTSEEHERFLEALQLYPSGPWEAIAEHVGTKNSRQTMTHAQKYRQKFERRQRGLRATSKKPARASKATPKTTSASRPIITTVVVHERVGDEEAAEEIRPIKKHKPDTPINPHVMLAPKKVVETPTPVSITVVESPRSGEEECDTTGASATTASSSPIKGGELFPTLDVERLENALMTELFTDFDPLQSIQTWSTNSLFDVAMDELSALPEEFSQAAGLWMA
ncbi:hypothetical protein PINS_up011148 [Pythium insidiosum]|nr:hypothetical protein PINS_up011148 [Pythium insidiosum]